MKSSDAYWRIRTRLEGEVGGIIDLIRYNNTHISETGRHPLSPFWSLSRILFPIAEALGGLHYQSEGSNVLPKIMKEYMSRSKPEYGSLANVITQMYRHSLIHTDEMRCLESDAGQLRWIMTIDSPENHLSIVDHPDSTKSLNFDVTAFYEDLITLCDELYVNDFNQPKVGIYYETWLNKYVSLDSKYMGEKEATRELAELFRTQFSRTGKPAGMFGK